MAYLAGRYPAVAWGEPSALRLGGGWLVEALASSGYEGDGTEGAGQPRLRSLVMVSPEGSVEEVGAGSLSRRSAHRGLAILNSTSAESVLSP